MLIRLSDIKLGDFSRVGAKAFNLGMLLKQGVNVPTGYVITSEVYEDFITSSGIEDAIEALLKKKANKGDLSREIKGLFEEKILDKDLEDALEVLLDKSNSKVFSIRSSSTLEDLPGLSFAGQYDSYLNVSRDNISTSVIKCWASLWNERAIDYREKNKMTGKINHAVIIQEMVDSQSSGVVFTANPLNGLRNELIINSAYGLGEGIVSGEISPDEIVVDKSTKVVISQKLAKKTKAFKRSHKGSEYIGVEMDKQMLPSLSDECIKRLTEVSIKVEGYYKNPQDIEFAFDGKGQLFILQSRAITTLYPIENLAHDGKLRGYMMASNVMLGVREPWTPLGADLYGGMFPTVINVMVKPKRPVTDEFVRYEGCRLMLDLTYLLSRKFVAKQLGKAFSGSDLPLEDAMNAMIDDYGKVFTKQGIRFKIPFTAAGYVFKMIPKVLNARKFKPETRYGEIKKMGQAFYSERKLTSHTLKTVEEKWQFCEETMFSVFVLTQDQAMYCVEVNNFAKISKQLNKYFGDTYNPDVLTYSLPGCYTVEMNLQLNELAKYFYENNQMPTKDHQRVKAFLEVFGFRGNIELDFGTERWMENPAYVIDQIKTFMKDQMYRRNIQDVEDKRIQAETMIKEVSQALVKVAGKRKAAKLRKMMIEYRIAAGMREYPKYNIVQGLYLARQIMMQVGASFVDEGLIDLPEDIFYIRKNDLESRGHLREKIADYKDNYAREKARTSIPRLVLNNGATYYTANKIDPNSKILKGNALSSGVYEGRVRIVIDLSESALQEGEVLVTETTNPAWTPLFMTAKGLIMEHGGPLSHGGIVAREYGIPAVVGIESATTIFKDGQLVRVDGNNGIIEIIQV